MIISPMLSVICGLLSADLRDRVLDQRTRCRVAAQEAQIGGDGRRLDDTAGRGRRVDDVLELESVARGLSAGVAERVFGGPDRADRVEREPLQTGEPVRPG